MRAIDWARRHPLPSGALLGLALGTVVGLALPIRASAPEDGGKAEWSLPAPASLSRFDEAQFARVRQAGAWGAAATGPDATKPAAWRLAGIISRPVPVALVMATGSKSAVRVRAGDVLPDGGKVLQVTPRALVFERDGCRQERVLYTAADPAGGCPPPADAANESPGK